MTSKAKQTIPSAKPEVQVTWAVKELKAELSALLREKRAALLPNAPGDMPENALSFPCLPFEGEPRFTVFSVREDDDAYYCLLYVFRDDDAPEPPKDSDAPIVRAGKLVGGRPGFIKLVQAWLPVGPVFYRTHFTYALRTIAACSCH